MSTDGEGTKWRRIIADIYNCLSRVHERYRQRTDRQTTNGRATANSEREREFTRTCMRERESTFANKIILNNFRVCTEPRVK